MSPKQMLIIAFRTQHPNHASCPLKQQWQFSRTTDSPFWFKITCTCGATERTYAHDKIASEVKKDAE